MCNLNVFIKANKTRTRDLNKLVSFLNCATTRSFINNPDGDGVYFNYNDTLIKSKNKINLLNYSEEIKNSKFILSHQRLATHGLSKKYTQPFKNEEFVLLHNGILNKFADKDYSDTFGFFKLFLELFKNNKETDREKNICFCAKTLLNNVGGSFSIVLFDKKTQLLYYFKNGSTQINFYRSKDKKQAYLTTPKENKNILDIYKNDFEECNFYNYKIYKIFFKKGLILYTIIGNIEYQSYYYDYEYQTKKYNKKTSDNIIYSLGNGNLYKNEVINNNSLVLNAIKEDGYIIKNNKKCHICNTPTNIYNKYKNLYTCIYCLSEDYI